MSQRCREQPSQIWFTYTSWCRVSHSVPWFTFSQECNRITVFPGPGLHKNATLPRRSRFQFFTGIGLRYSIPWSSLPEECDPVTVFPGPSPLERTISGNVALADAQVGALVVSECSECSINPNARPAAPALLSLPGLVNVRQMRDFTPGAAFLGSLIVQNTAMGTLTSFQGLVCPPGFFNISGNYQLASFFGLQNLGFPSFLPGVRFYALNNPMTSPAAIQGIRVLAGCPTGISTPQRSAVLIATSGCTIQVRPLATSTGPGGGLRTSAL